MKLLKNGVRKLVLCAVIVLTTWVLLEVALIFLDPVLFKGFYMYDSELGFRVRSHINGTNEFGFNDQDHGHEKPKGVYRILFLGDSFNWSGLRDCSYTAFLKKKLSGIAPNVEIINAGYPMTGPVQQLKILKRYGMIYHPDMVVLAFFVGNDFSDSGPYRKRIVVNGLYFDIDERTERQFLGYPILPYSRVHRILSQYNQVRQSVQTFQPTHAKGEYCSFPDQPTFTEEAHQLGYGTLIYFMSNSKPDIDSQAPSIANAARAIHEMKDLVTQQGASFKAFIFPDEFQLYPELREAVLRRFNKKDSDIELLRPQRLVKTIFEKEGIPYLDLFPAFSHEALNKKLYCPRNTHLNREGNELTSDTLLNWISDDLKPGSLKKE